jgi:toxin ParE1/3/4
VREVQFRSRAVEDLDAALDHLVAEGRSGAAVTLVDAVEAATNHLAKSPNSGSLRLAYELGIPDLRAWPLRRWPYVIFYVAHDDRIDVLRILHTKRDIPATLADGRD